VVRKTNGYNGRVFALSPRYKKLILLQNRLQVFTVLVTLLYGVFFECIGHTVEEVAGATVVVVSCLSGEITSASECFKIFLDSSYVFARIVFAGYGLWMLTGGDDDSQKAQSLGDAFAETAGKRTS